jgi:hypothetical protein
MEGEAAKSWNVLPSSAIAERCPERSIAHSRPHRFSGRSPLCDMRLPREECMLAAPPPHHVVGAFVLASDPIKQEKA